MSARMEDALDRAREALRGAYRVAAELGDVNIARRLLPVVQLMDQQLPWTAYKADVIFAPPVIEYVGHVKDGVVEWVKR